MSLVIEVKNGHRKNSTDAETSSQELLLRSPHPKTNVLLLSIKWIEKETNISAFSSVLVLYASVNLLLVIV